MNSWDRVPSVGRVLHPRHITVMFLFLLAFGVTSANATAPSITSLSVTSAKVNGALTITGTNFGSSQGSSYVTINGTQVTTYVSWSTAGTSIKVDVPVGALPTGDVKVTVSGSGTSNGVAFTVFPYISPSTASPPGLSLNSGPAMMAFDINGSSFGNTQDGNTVDIGTTGFTVVRWSNTQIEVQVPAGASTGNVVVTVGGNASNTEAFTIGTYNSYCPSS